MGKAKSDLVFSVILLLALTAFPTLAVAAAQNGEEGVREHTESSAADVPRRVQFFVWMIDIDAIDSQNQTFTVKMGLRLSWRDQKLVHDGPESMTVSLKEIWHPRISLGRILAKTRIVMDEEAEVTPDGTVIYRQHFIGPLSQPLDLSEFPLDTQTFTAHFVASGLDTTDVVFEPKQIQAGDDLVIGGFMSSELLVTDWRIVSFNAEPRSFVAANEIHFAGFAFEFTATRLFKYYLWQAIAPLTLIVFMSWVPFWVNPSDAGTQFRIATTTVLTLIAYRFVAAGYVPKLPYMTRLDAFTFACTLLVFGVVLQVLVTSRLADFDRAKLAIRIDKYCRLGFPLMFALLVIRYWLL